MSLINEALKKAEQSERKPDTEWSPIQPEEPKGSPKKRLFFVLVIASVFIVAGLALWILSSRSKTAALKPKELTVEKQEDTVSVPATPTSALLGKPVEEVLPEKAPPSEKPKKNKPKASKPKKKTIRKKPAKSLTKPKPVAVAEKERLRIPSKNLEEAERYYLFGLTKERAGEVFLAINAYRRALELNPSHLQARINLGALLIERRQYRSAIEVLQKALEKGDNPKVLFNLALACYGAGRLKESIEYLRRTLALNPNHSRAYLLLGDIAEKTGNREAALENYRKAFEVDSGSPEVLYKLARELDLLGRTEEAIRYYTEFLKRSNNSEMKEMVERRILYLKSREEN